MSRSKRIAVLYGGPSAEAAVSRVSAAGVADALRSTFTDVEEFELGPDLAEALRAFAPDVVFPVLHGPPGEDGTLQGFLEILGYPYVGSGVAASAVGMDKVLSKRSFAAANLPLAAQVVVLPDEPAADAVARITAALGDQVVVKPTRQGSALGVQLVANPNELAEAIGRARTLGDPLLVEERIIGREITCGVLDTEDGPIALPVTEIRTPGASWYDYEHRYTAGLSEHLMPAPLPADQLTRLEAIAISAHTVLGCRDLSRADFVVTDEGAYLLEVNTMPGMTPTSLYPEAAAHIGKPFPDLVAYLVERAARRAP